MGRIEPLLIEPRQQKRYQWINEDKENAPIFRAFIEHLEKLTGKALLGRGQGQVQGQVQGQGQGQVLAGPFIIADSIKSLPDFLKEKKDKALDYDETERLIAHIGLQLMLLKNYNKAFLYISLEDIAVIDSTYFFIGNLHQALNIYKTNMLFLSYPMTIAPADEAFLAPEVKKQQKMLPLIVSFTVGYYSLAKICLHCLRLGDNLNPLLNSKMYFFLERCLNTDPEKRVLLYL